MKNARLKAKEKNILRENESTSPNLTQTRLNPFQDHQPLDRQLSKNLTHILKKTSRAFYLSLALLPARARRPLSLAYLLARAADTVADSGVVPGADRAHTLREIKRSVDAPELVRPSDLGQYLPTHEGELALLESFSALLFELSRSEPENQRAISGVVKTLVDGMLWDQELFDLGEAPRGLSDEELERYTYLVAGCVGPFWSFVCAGRDPRLRHLNQKREKEVALEFGRALQYVNILRDIPKDQENGRLYLPGLNDSDFSVRFLKVSKRALTALKTACQYPCFFPPIYLRHRWSVLLPLVLGLRTLEKLFLAGGPRQGERIKVSRLEVLLWLGFGPLLLLNDQVLQAVLSRLCSRAETSLTDLENRTIL